MTRYRHLRESPERKRVKCKGAEREQREFLAAQNDLLITETAKRLRDAAKPLPGYLQRRLKEVA